jgi:hypothetical protein
MSGFREVMNVSIRESKSRGALWSRRVALFAAQLLILTVILHHLGGLSTPPAINLVFVSLAAALVALLLGMLAFARIWIKGSTGGGRAAVGMLIAVATLAPPLYFLPKLLTLPHLTDISTDTANPPDYAALASVRPDDANAMTIREGAAEAQQAAYPDIRTMELERPAAEVFDLVTQAVRRLGWDVAVAEPPGNSGLGRIEATNKTMLMGFTDDVVVRVGGDDAHATVDVRSSSRYGLHDFGANADRIRLLFAEVKADLAKGETTGLEQLAGEGGTAVQGAPLPRRAGPPKKKEPPKAAAVTPDETPPQAAAPRRRSERARVRSRAQGERRRRARQERPRRDRDDHIFWGPFGRW